MYLNKFSNEVKLMLYCARSKIDIVLKHQIQKLLQSFLDWNFIVYQSEYHEISPLIYYNLKKVNKSNIPEEIFNILRNSYHATLVKNIYFWREFCIIQDALNQIGIKVIPLKGIILAETLYHNLSLRPMGDIDILVREDDLSIAEKKLQLLGYQKCLENLPETYWRKYRHHFPLYNPYKNVSLEVHWAPAPPHPNKLNLKEMWERSYIQIINQRKILTLSTEDTLLSLVLHICRKITSLQYLKFKNLCDINELIIQSQNLNWDYILNKAVSWKIKGAIFYMHLLTRRYLSTPWPTKVPDVCKLNTIPTKILNFFVERRFILKEKNHLRPKSKFYASLSMLLMADTIKDYFALGIQKLFIMLSKFFMRKTKKVYCDQTSSKIYILNRIK